MQVIALYVSTCLLKPKNAQAARQVLADLQARADEMQRAAEKKKQAMPVEAAMDDVEATQVVESQGTRPVATPARAPATLPKGISSDAQPREQDLWDHQFWDQGDDLAGTEPSLI